MTIQGLAQQLAAAIGDLPEEARIEALNHARAELHLVSPFAAEPVDLVLWVRAAEVEANDYNPNSVAPPELALLELSIKADGYTQPIVTAPEDGKRVVIDGFHRNRVGRESVEVGARVRGYLPVVSINPDRGGRQDRIASTIRHNRARGKHGVKAMSSIVIELHRRNWGLDRIGKELGMDQDEVLRLLRTEGLAALYASGGFSEAWEPTLDTRSRNVL